MGPEDPEVMDLDNPAIPNSQLPYLYTDNTGQLYFSWMEPGETENEYRLLYSKLMEDGWTDPNLIQQSSEWFVNWADFPSIIGYDGNVMASHQLRKVPGNTYSYEIDMTVHRSGGWSETFTPHFDSTSTEHGFVSMTPLDEQQYMAVWLDGRQTDKRSDADYFDLDKAMSLRSAIINRDGKVMERTLIDDTVCDCCPTSMAMTKEGPIAAYRNRAEGEIRDIFTSRYIDGAWSDPVAVHEDSWKIGACPVNGPKIVADGSKVAIAWYTAGDGEPAVKVAYSSDSGKNFGNPITINKGSTLGRVDIAMPSESKAYVSEINKRGDQHYLTVHKISFESGEIKSFELAEISGSRSSGFPQMERQGSDLFFAWTEVEDDKPVRLKTAVLKNL